MKKYLLTFIPFLFLVSGCNNNKTNNNNNNNENDYVLDLSIAAPAGAPSACLYKYINDSEHITIVDTKNAGDLVNVHMSQNKDVVIMPTNAGVQAIKNKNVPYKLAANITFGNLFIASTGHDTDGVMNGDDYVAVIQQNNFPDVLFKYVYGDLGLSNVHYLTNAAPAQVLISGKNSDDNNALVDYILIPEPAFSAAKAKNPNVTQYASLQDEYKKKAGDKEITQASIFINNNVNKEKANKFLSALKNDIESFINDASILDSYVKDLDDVQFANLFGVPNATLLKNLTTNGNRMGLGYKDAFTNKSNIDQFLSLWPAIGETSEEIYFK